MQELAEELDFVKTERDELQTTVQDYVQNLQNYKEKTRNLERDNTIYYQNEQQMSKEIHDMKIEKKDQFNQAVELH